jgi:filamentous hemagglutinin family protein
MPTRPARFASLFGAAAAVIAAAAPQGAELPVPCVAGVCGAAASTFVTSGVGSAVQSGNTLTVNQTTPSATFNWQSFNISADGTVTFKQPDAGAVALNQIFQSDASRILGALNANGRVFLLNQNGIVFGAGAQVNVGGLVASSLQITQAAIDNGIAQAVRDGQPAFVEVRNAEGELVSGAIRIERGAVIDSAGGQVLVFAPEVTNDGTIRTPDGQTILAAGSKVYLLASNDPNLRGLLVEVDTSGAGSGTVTNGDAAANATAARPEDLVGQIIAERGNVTLAGLAVNQNGRISATTSTRFNGSIRLQARDTVTLPGAGAQQQLRANRGGTLTTGAGSRTEVTLDATDTSTAVDVSPQPRSSLLLSGDRIHVLERSVLRATAGTIALSAQRDPSQPVSRNDTPRTDSRVYVAPGALLDVSGASTELPMERNVVEVQLRANEVRDSPQQRDGALRGQTVRVDVRRSGTLADGTVWEGTPIADVSGAIDNVPRGVAERNLAGGTVTIESQGDVVLSAGATVDVSGGSVRYRDGYIDTSRVVSGGRIFDIGDADPARTYDGIVDAFTVTDPVWGVTRVFPGFPSLGVFTPGYVEGKDAGTIGIIGRGLVLDSSFVGTVTAGRLQRQPTRSFGSDRPYRPHDQIPQAGRLIIGRNIDASPVRLTPDVRFGMGSAPLDPVAALAARLANEVVINPNVLGPRNMGSLLVFSDGRITVPQDVSLSPAAGGGELRLAGRAVDFAGTLRSAGAGVTLIGEALDVPAAEVSVRLAPSALIDVSGRWINDNPLLPDAANPAPLLTSGGSVRAEASSGTLSVEAGSVIDVSAGALRRADGRIQAGMAGSITIRDIAPQVRPAASVRLGGTLRGHSIGRGGTLSLSAGAVCIAESGCLAEGALPLEPAFFSSGGFSSYSVTTTRGDLHVLPGTVVAPRAASLVIDSDVSLVPSGTPLRAFARESVLPDPTRPAVNVSLAVAARSDGVGPFSSATFGRAPRLEVGSGALFDMDVGSSLALRSSTSMIVSGLLRAPAGRITLELDNTLSLDDFAPQQAIWLAPGAQLAAPGAVRVTTDDRGLRQGQVLPGGTVTVRASRGYFFADPGSVIDVSGVAADIDVRDSTNSASFAARRIASAGGLIDVFAAEGAQLAGSLLGRAGAGDIDVAGGELRLAIDPNNRAEVTTDSATGRVSLFPGGSRTILLTQQVSPNVVQPGTASPASLNGIGQLAVSTVEAGGFSSLSLVARNVLNPSSTLRSAGRLTADGDVTLRMPGRLVLDVPRIEGAGARMNLSAGSYLAVGSTDLLTQETGTPDPGTGELSLSGGLVDLIGNTALSGFGRALIRSETDIRGRGIQLTNTRSLDGSLSSSGDLTLRAAQVYPTTLSSFRLETLGAENVLRIEPQPGASRGAVLSAAGTLRLRAPSILVSGALVAPFGAIDLGQAGAEVTVASGGLVSVSGSGLAVPFGSTQGGFDWVYELAEAQTLVFGTRENHLAPPERRVAITGDFIDVAAGSIIDAAGGGELLATEFVPGVGGTRDVLSPAISPAAFAVVPALSLAYAPFDTGLYAGSSVRPGDAVYLGAGSGLPEGLYAMLPARYALLPGAYLVTPVSGYQDIALGESARLLDGTAVVAGYRTLTGVGYRDGRTSGFQILTGADVLQRARYTTTTASSFFAAQADAAGVVRPRLPADAGLLSFAASQRLALNATLQAAPATGGRGAEVDITSRNIRVTGASGSANAGELAITADSLNRLGAASILLGGSRTRTAEGIRIATSADQVTFDEGSRVESPELLATARESLTFEAGSVAIAMGAGAGATGSERSVVSLSGDGAFARVASGAQIDLRRGETTGTSGALAVREGARLESNGAVTLEATARAELAGELTVTGASLALAAPRISIGEQPTSADALVLSSAQLEALGLRELELASRSTIDFGRSISLALRGVRLRAAGLTAAAPDSIVSITADDVQLEGIEGAAPLAPAPGSGSFTLASGSMRLLDGNLSIEGFGRTSLVASGEMRFAGLDLSAGRDLRLDAARVTGETGIASSATARGQLETRASAASGIAAQAADAVPLGASLTLRGASIDHGGRIELASGRLRMEATATSGPGVIFGAGSITDLSGRDFELDGQRIGSDGGRLIVAAQSGGIDVRNGALVDVSAAQSGADAGVIDFAAANGLVGVSGQLRGDAAEGFASGSFLLDAQRIADLDGLNGILNSGGFTRERRFRVRGEGAVFRGAGSTAMRADTVALVADGGGIDMLGEIVAGGASPRVTLAARDGVRLRGSIDARGERPGVVELLSRSGDIDLASGSTIQLSQGALRLRLPAASALSILDADPANDRLRLAGTVSGSARTDLEGFTVFDDLDRTITAAEVAATPGNPRFAAAQSFASNAAPLATALGRGDDATFHVLPGIEIRSSGDLRLASDWNLFAWRFGSEPGVLTLRAQGDLTFDASLSDGFTAANSFALPEIAGDSWSYRLTAGADLASADPLAVLDGAQLAPARGNFRIAAGTTALPRAVRTGTGFIDVAAGRDLLLAAQTSVLYTAGAASGGITLGALNSTGILRQYPDRGGDITIRVEGNILGARSNQLVTDWLWRAGRPDGVPSPSATGWTVNFQRFQQGIAALGGGDVSVRAGGDVQDLSVSIPTIGRQVGGATPQASRVEVIGGGDLDLDVGGTLRGGSFYVGRGSGFLRADDVARSGTGASAFLPVLALGDATMRMTSRRNVGIEAAVNPTLLRQAQSQGGPLVRSFFSTYGETSAISLAAQSGEVSLGGNVAALANSLSSIPFQTSGGIDERLALRLYPPSLRAVALAGDVRLGSGFALFPSRAGNLELFAERNVLLAPVAQQSVEIIVSDADPEIFPRVTAPQISFGPIVEVIGAGATTAPTFHARTPVHGGPGADSRPVRLVARTGDVRVEAPLDSPILLSTPKATRVVAGRDIVDLTLLGQNVAATDVTSVIAGRDVRFSTQRDQFGRIRSSEREIVLAGPGRLEISAGRDIDLQTSRGIETNGNLFNPALAPAGASVSLSVGAGAQGAAARVAFIQRYLEQGSLYDSELLAYASLLAGRAIATKGEALAILRAAPASQQAALVEQVFFAELRASGRAAARAGNSDFRRAFEAIETLYPGANPDLEAGETNPYRGDLRLFFSRIYTLDGGDVSLLVPGGEINAGLATPPAAFGITKQPSELGVVVQSTGSVNAFSFRDFLVNESRVFAADGGNILVWSTRGDIDAGRGAKTAISAPPPTITIDDDGRTVVSFPAALTGSGIQTLATSAGRKPGDVDLFAPRGVVNASDAGIVAGNLTVAATAVLGTSNITVSGASVGVPVDTGALSVGVTSASSAGTSATTAAESSLESGEREQSRAPLADEALGWLEVFVEGFGEEVCKPDDVECLKRNRRQ